jgi:hypothetical protein
MAVTFTGRYNVRRRCVRIFNSQNYVSVILAISVCLQPCNRSIIVTFIFDMFVQSMLVSSKNGLGQFCGRYG